MTATSKCILDFQKFYSKVRSIVETEQALGRVFEAALHVGFPGDVPFVHPLCQTFDLASSQYPFCWVL